MRVRLVVNPLARRGAILGEEVGEALRRRGVEVVAGDGNAEFDAIVAAGGDGTLVRQIPDALALGVPIGIVPLGTFNDLSRTLAIPGELGAACDVIAAGVTRAVDVARVNGAYFLSEASIGISSRLARLQRPEDKQKFGFLAVLATTLQAVRYARPFHVELYCDGRQERLRVIQLTIANSERFGGIISVDDAAIDDGWLDCYCVNVESFVQFLGVAGAIVSGKRRSAQGLRAFRARAFEVRTRRAHHVTADGEPAGKTPARFELLPAALRVFAPG